MKQGDDVPKLLHMYVYATRGCNLRCGHCWVDASQGREDAGQGRSHTPEENLSIDDLRLAIGQAVPLGLRRIKITGGEPLLREDFCNLYKVCWDASEDVSLETNGTVVPPGFWNTMVRIPPTSVAVSMDSMDSSIHDAFRGLDGAWEMTGNFICGLVRRGIRTLAVKTVLPEDTTATILDTIERLLDLGVSAVKLNPIRPIGRAAALDATESDVSGLMRLARAISERFGQRAKIALPPALQPLSALKYVHVCPLLNLISLLPGGRISLCGIASTRPELVLGSIHEDGIAKVWADSPILHEIREKLPRKLQTPCSRCMLRDNCLGFCPMNNYAIGGDFAEPDDRCIRAVECGEFPESRLS
ncbi:MAG: radical SAM protein [Armatimonadota bacterium]